MNYVLLIILTLFQFNSLCFAETGTNEHPINLPMMNDYTIHRDPHSQVVELYQSQMPNNDVLAVYSPANTSSNLPIIITSKMKDIYSMGDAEWLDSRLAIIEDIKQKHPNVSEINSTSEISSKISHLRSAFAFDNAKREDVKVVKLILERNEAITTIYSAKLKADNNTYIGSITMLLLNGNIIILSMEWPDYHFSDFDVAHKYIDGVITQFIEANPKTTNAFSLSAAQTNPLKANTLPAEKVKSISKKFDFLYISSLLIFVPLILLLYIIQHLINRKVTISHLKISFLSLLFSWKGKLTGLQCFLGSISALVFYTILFFIPLVLLAMTSVEHFTRHVVIFNSVFLCIVIGLIYSLIVMMIKYIRGK